MPTFPKKPDHGEGRAILTNGGRPIFGGPDDGRPNVVGDGKGGKGGGGGGDGGGGGGGDGGDGPRREGLRVKLDPIPGVTPKKLMPRNGFYFQCPPLDEFGTEYAFSHTDYDTPVKGQFSRKGGRQLRIATFDTLVVDQGLFTIIQRDIHIEDFNERLVKICERGDPFVLTVAHQMPPHGYDTWGQTLAGPELQMEATLRSVKIAEKAGEGDARYLNVSFVEYREPFVAESALGKPKRRNHKSWPKVVLLKKDGSAEVKGTNKHIGRPPLKPVTLHQLARDMYHEPRLWEFIGTFRKNKIRNWGANDSLVDYFTDVRHLRNWPAKIHIPKPPDVGRGAAFDEDGERIT